MKIKLKRGPLQQALARLTNTADPVTGERKVYRSLDALKAACPLERVVAQVLDHGPEDPDVNRLKFFCFNHEADWRTVGHTPSLYVNVSQQRWGCETGCFDGRSDDVVGFARKALGLDQKEALVWLETWAHYHRPRVLKVRLQAGRGAL